MDSKNLGLKVASVVFALISLIQLARLLLRPEVRFEGSLVPLWPSVLAFVLFGGLSVWLWMLARITLGKKLLRFYRSRQ